MALAPLLLRLALAAVFFGHGAQKLFGAFGGPGLNGTASGFASMGLKPAVFLAIVAAVLETAGGLLLLAGQWTRLVAALIALEMLFALFAVHAHNGFFLNFACTPGRGHGIEYNVVLIASLLALVLLGPGRASLDALRTGRRRRGLVQPPVR
jgi:putative oxidoreductase